MHEPVYAINITDGRIILCTKESLNNVYYVRISRDTAEGIAHGRYDPKDVIGQINRKMQMGMTKMENWDEYQKKRSHMNLRSATLNLTDSEGSQTNVEDDDIFEFSEEDGADTFSMSEEMKKDEPVVQEEVQKPKPKPRGRPSKKDKEENELDIDI